MLRKKNWRTRLALSALPLAAWACVEARAQDAFGPTIGPPSLGGQEYYEAGAASPAPAVPVAGGSAEASAEDETNAGPKAFELFLVDTNSSAPEKDRLGDLEKKYNDLLKRLDKEKKAADDKAKTAANTFPTQKITGFTQLDTGYFNQDIQNRNVVGDAQDGTGYRRLRLATQGKVAEFTSWQLEVDFATAGRPSFFDNYINQGNLPVFGDVRVGQFCQPFSIDSLTGFRNLVFLERSLPFLAFVPFRRIGVQSSNGTEDRMTNWQYSVYRTGGFQNAPMGDNRNGVDFGDVGGYSVAGRITHLLWYDEPADDRYLVHVGAGYTLGYLGANDAAGSASNRPFYQSRTSPEFGTLGNSELPQGFGNAVNGNPSFVDTGRFEANHFNLWGVEAMTQWGAWSVTGEYMATLVASPYGDVFYDGGYLQAAYHLTGEHRIYDKKTGTLGKLVPFTDFIPLKKDGIAGWGAWEVGARWSYLDLRNPDFLNGHFFNSGTGQYTGLLNAQGGGQLNDATLGITWFLNTHTKLQVNWIHAMLDSQNSRAGGPNGGFSTANLFVGRAQVDF